MAQPRGLARLASPKLVLVASAVAFSAAGCLSVHFNHPVSSSSEDGENGTSASLSIALVSPSSGTGNGGTVITIEGASFEAADSVTVGGFPCTALAYVSPTELQCETPAHAAGIATVTVTDPSGAGASLASAYEFTAGASWIGANLSRTNGFVSGATFGCGKGDGAFNCATPMIAVDSAHDYLYTSDASYSVVQRFKLSTGVFAGAIGKLVSSAGTCPSSGAAPGWCDGGSFGNGTSDGMFSVLRGIAVDSNGAIYVADGSDRVEKFDSSGAFVGAIGKATSSTGTCVVGAQNGWCTGGVFAQGSGDGMFSGTTDIRVDSTGNLYVLDGNNARVEKFDSSGAFVGAIGHANSSSGTCVVGAQTAWCTGGTFAVGSGDGEFGNPSGISVDSTGNFYVSDESNHRIEKFSSAGAFLGAIGVASSSTGTCVVGTQSAWCTGGTFAGGTNEGEFDTPTGIAVDSAGSLYVGDGAWVQKFSSAGAFVGAIGDASSSTGTCVVGTQSAWCTGGAFTGGTGDGMFFNPGDLDVDLTDGSLYVAQYNRVDHFSSSGGFDGALGGMVLHSDRWITAQDPVILPISDTADGGFQSPNGLDVDPAGGFLYATDWSNKEVERFNLSNGAFMGAIGYATSSTGTCVGGVQSGWCTGGHFAFGTSDGSFGTPSTVLADPEHGFLYVTDNSAFKVDKFNLSTGAFIGAIGKTTSSTGTCPASGTASGWCTGGTFMIGTGDGTFWSPEGIAADFAHGFLYVSDMSNHSIQKFDLATGAFVGAIGKATSSTGTCVVGAQSGWCTGGTFGSGSTDGEFYAPQGMAVDSAGGLLYVADRANRRVVKVNLATGAFAGAIGGLSGSTGSCPSSGASTGWCTGGNFVTGTGDGYMELPSAVFLDTAGDFLYVVDNGNHRLEKFGLATGAFIGAVGYATASTGSCASSGFTESWCTGGVFKSGENDGQFVNPTSAALDPASGLFYVTDANAFRIQRLSLP